MQAALMAANGKLEFSHVRIPFPKAGQCLLEVHAAGLNPVDWKMCAYNFFHFQLPHGLGTDVSGVIRQVGDEVKDFKKNDAVVSSVNLAEVGSFAEFVNIYSHVTTKTNGLAMDVAACLPVAFLSAYEVFVHPKVKELMANKKSKLSILVPGGGGGVGHMAVGLAKHFGFDVIATGSRAESIAVMKESGADHIIDYKKEKVLDAVKKIAPNGVDLVFDSTYQDSSFLEAATLLKDKGLFCTLGNMSDAKSAHGAAVLAKEGTIICVDLVPYSVASTPAVQHEHIGLGLEEAVKLIHAGKFKPHISKRVAFPELSDALNALKSGSSVGKVVVNIKRAL
jgi:NADPH:quinone reductase-like Zn-dependent oxidoreductase